MPFRPGISDRLAPHIESLIEENKENLIKSSVVDRATRDKLLEINKQITELKGMDPGLVAAWGLGCGGSCLTTPIDVGELVRR